MTDLTVNGQPVRYRISPDTPLLHALRDVSNLTGTKYGCGTCDCGACTIHVDGRAARSCRVSLSAVEGAAVTTIEGLSSDRGHPVQQAFAEAGLVQCGFCLPGFVMAAAALIAADPRPTRDDIVAALTNLCRCGIQPRVVRAVLRAAAMARGEIRISALPPPGMTAADAARVVPAMRLLSDR
ncbi:(2Fe-2S)-binding protein [Sphingomonas sp.]|uniref:(2Fe-2S)-binding protein n=1 Tax=Sphingomonas sp. TaxID=28214 RepID=UPI003AFFDE87